MKNIVGNTDSDISLYCEESDESNKKVLDIRTFLKEGGVSLYNKLNNEVTKKGKLPKFKKKTDKNGSEYYEIYHCIRSVKISPNGDLICTPSMFISKTKNPDDSFDYDDYEDVVISIKDIK